jgi:hypothetical protein
MTVYLIHAEQIQRQSFDGYILKIKSSQMHWNTERTQCGATWSTLHIEAIMNTIH